VARAAAGEWHARDTERRSHASTPPYPHHTAATILRATDMQWQHRHGREVSKRAREASRSSTRRIGNRGNSRGNRASGEPVKRLLCFILESVTDLCRSRAEADRMFRDAFGGAGNADILRKFEEMARRMRRPGGGFPGGALGGIGAEELEALLRGAFGQRGSGFTTTSQEMYIRPDGVRVVRTTTVVQHGNGRTETRCRPTLTLQRQHTPSNERFAASPRTDK
jgi:hypothetical protein